MEVRGILFDTQGKIAEIFRASVACNRHLTLANWLKYEDTCSKFFFDFHRIGKKKTLMRELETDSGTIMGQQDLTHHVTSFYSRLYTSDANTPSIAKAQVHCWQSVPTKVTGDVNASLTSRLSLEEVRSAICTLSKGKTPGHDGIPMEFFHECEQEVEPDLLQAFTAMLSEGTTSTFINKGVITLIPKVGDRARFNNWRPITLLGSVYKILAKVFAGRLQAALLHIIRPNQIGFVEGRSILDNVFIA